MTAAFDEIGLLALNAGHVLLVRHPGEDNWRIPRTAPLAGEDRDAALLRLITRLGIDALEDTELGVREVDGRMFDLHRVRIPGLPAVSDHEVRLVRLAYLPKELAAPDKPLLDALLSG
jgi:hypothetical protein